MSTASSGGSSSSFSGGAKKRVGPSQESGEARSLQMGSVSTRAPSSSTSTDEWPNQVSRRPSAGGVANAAPSVFAASTAWWGLTSGLTSNSANTERHASLRSGWGFSK